MLVNLLCAIPVRLVAWNKEYNNLDCKDELQRNSIDIDQFDLSKVDLCKVNDQKTTLCTAMEMNNIDLFERLSLFLKYIRRDPVKYPREKVVYLITGCGSKISKSKISKSKIIRGMEMPLLSRAMLKGNLEVIKLLFETLRDYDLNVCEEVFSIQFGRKKYTILHQAVELLNLEIVEYLINKFIETKKEQGLTSPSALSRLVKVLNIRNNINLTPMDLAFKAYSYNFPNSLKMLQYLAQYGDPSSQIELRANSFLHDVAADGKFELLSNMINVIREGSKKINNCQDEDTVSKIVNLLDKNCRTLLYHAVRNGSYVAVEYLMKLGSDCTSFDKNRTSPLLIAIGYCDLWMVKLLLYKEFPGNVSLASNINKQGIEGLTPLSLAVWCADGLIISSIVKFSDRIRKFNKDFVFSGNIGRIDLEIVKVLLESGANPSIPDILG